MTVTAPADPATQDHPDPEHPDPDGLAVAPTRLTHPEWVAALERALRAQFAQR